MPQKRTFLRLYSLKGHKFNKGYFVGVTDSSILIHKKDTIEIPVTSIGSIRINRSTGLEVLMSGLSFALPLTALGAIVGGVNAGGFGAGVGTLVGFSLGTIMGIPIGAAGALFTKHTVFIINGDMNTWQAERKKIELLTTL